MAAHIILCSLILSRNRRLVTEVLPILKKLWTQWEMRSIILLSLTCQIILMILGNRRRYTKNRPLHFALWAAYTAADSLATFALGSISTVLNDSLHTGPIDPSLEIKALWTPFLLLHLGGVDTITAYSLEDNELWLRQLLNFVVQTGLVVYILLLAWSSTYLSILSFLILVVGIMNYGERIHALWCASYRQRKVRARSFDSIKENFDNTHSPYEATLTVSENLFADLLRERIGVTPSLWCVMNASFNQDKCMATGVELIELGLALMYDSIYTKTKVSHSGWDAAMRCNCFLLTSISLLLFCALNNQEKYSKTDLSITFALLTVAVLKELYGAFVFLTSHATLVWLNCFVASKTNVICVLTAALLKRITNFSWLRSPKWSNSMGQCSLLSYSLNEEPKGWWRISKLLSLFTKQKPEDKLKETCSVDQVPSDMKEWMFAYHMNQVCKTFMTREEKRDESHQVLELEDPDFGRSILVWHIVTEICYCLDHKRFPDHKKKHNGGSVETRSQDVYLNSKFSKNISRYMMYLVVMTPEMLQSGWDLSQARFSELLGFCEKLCTATATAAESSSVQEAKDEAQASMKKKARIQACSHFVEKYGKESGNYSKSEVLVQCVRHLEALKPEENESKLQDRWERLSGVWMELLANAANRCRANQHAQLLSQGGELLTFARLLLSWVGTE